MVQADAVVIAMGAWSGQAAGWLGEVLHPDVRRLLAGVAGVKAHSLVMQARGLT